MNHKITFEEKELEVIEQMASKLNISFSDTVRILCSYALSDINEVYEQQMLNKN